MSLNSSDIGNYKLIIQLLQTHRLTDRPLTFSIVCTPPLPKGGGVDIAKNTLKGGGWKNCFRQGEHLRKGNQS